MYPQTTLWKYTKNKILSNIQDIYLMGEMEGWEPTLKKDLPHASIHKLSWNEIEIARFDKEHCLIIALLTHMKDKYPYLLKLYNTFAPFVIYAPTSFLGLSKCGQLFRKEGINMEIIPQVIYFVDEQGDKRKPPFTVSIFTSKHFSKDKNKDKNALIVRDKICID